MTCSGPVGGSQTVVQYLLDRTQTGCKADPGRRRCEALARPGGAAAVAEPDVLDDDAVVVRTVR